MRLAAPPPDRRVDARHEHTGLLQSLAAALAAVGRHDAQLARTQAELGDIELPPALPDAQSRAQLEAAAPLYFASELEKAGLLTAAELIAGLFASGAIVQPLGPAAALVQDFWRKRRERLDANERNAIFARVIEMPHFDRLMGALCEAIIAQADGNDLRERVALESAAHRLAEFLAQRVDAMATVAARDVVANIEAALLFMRDRMLQAAFGARSLWSLVAIAASGTGPAIGADAVLRQVDRARAGQPVLLWLSAQGLEPSPRLDPAAANDAEVIAAAQRWLSGYAAWPKPAVVQALPVAA